MSGAQETADGDENPPPIASVQELLELHNVDASRLRQLIDGRPLHADETETLLRLLYAAGRLTPAETHPWTVGPDWPQLLDGSDERRGDLVQIEGRVERVTRETPIEEVVGRFDMPVYYRCDVTLGERGWPATVFARAVPSAWPIDEPVDELFSASAFYLKRQSDNVDDPQPVFVANRIAWHPDTPAGRLGMDQGLLAALKQNSDIQKGEQEAFYQLMSAAGRMKDPPAAAPTSHGSAAIVALLEQPAQHSGELVAFEGTALRAMLVRVDDRDAQRRFGIDHYYDVSLSVPLSPPIRLDGEVYYDFPVEACVLELPPGMPTGERIHEPVRINGFFFKNWRYRRPASDRTANPGQLAPLLIGRRIEWAKPLTTDNRTWGLAAGILVVAAIAALAAIVWRANRSDRAFREQVVQRLDPEADHVSFDHLDTTQHDE